MTKKESEQLASTLDVLARMLDGLVGTLTEVVKLLRQTASEVRKT